MEEQKNSTQAQIIEPIPSWKSLITGSFGLYRRVVKPILLVGSVPAAVALADYIFNYFGLTGLSALMGLVSVIIALFFYPALMIVITSEGNPAGIKSAGSAYKESWPILGSYLVLVSLMAIVAAGGFLLLIIPVIYVGVMVSLSPFVWLIEGKRGKDALAVSWFYIKGNWRKLFWSYLFTGILLAVIQGIISGIFSAFFPPQQLPIPASSIPYNIPSYFLTTASPEVTLVGSLLGYLFSVPISIAFGFVIYRFLKSQKENQLNDVVLASSRKSISRFMILGIVAMVLLVIVILGAFSFALFQLKGFV